MSHDLTFAGEGVRTSVNDDTGFNSAPSREPGHVLRAVHYGIRFCDRRTVIALESFYAV